MLQLESLPGFESVYCDVIVVDVSIEDGVPIDIHRILSIMYAW